ncbi:ribonuclease domain-containing protein [Trichococcus sp. K1Tr]|uniref:ribonuclease domain-containing protein n=1 Tax=Trichococcus sp. K1Tr TaxID=3020847 RepID=UPI00232B94F8|nr:ribonuclease domain-containing protein [Trichococcus sp. K1Tr]MDB6353382.1 ribonuclease domain-containing protein [Trichococcus sp. K1Tr]
MKNLKSGLKGLFALLAIILAVWVNGVDSLFEEQAPDSSISIAASSSQAIEEGTQEAISQNETQESTETATSSGVTEGQAYSTKDEVAAYIHQFNALPPNYLTKDEAEELGWDNAEGNLWEVTDGMSIGGDFFGNREGLLPNKSGRTYYEADIDYDGGYRGAERIVYSNDGLIFYTDDHYESFEQLYWEGE